MLNLLSSCFVLKLQKIIDCSVVCKIQVSSSSNGFVPDHSLRRSQIGPVAKEKFAGQMDRFNKPAQLVKLSSLYVLCKIHSNLTNYQVGICFHFCNTVLTGFDLTTVFFNILYVGREIPLVYITRTMVRPLEY
jgi:hypothetical protein